MQGRKGISIKDGLSEESVVVLLQRIVVSNLARIYLIAPQNWISLASTAFQFLLKSHPVLVGGFVGSRQGSFSELLQVFRLPF
jgi:hypothetical protein